MQTPARTSRGPVRLLSLPASDLIAAIPCAAVAVLLPAGAVFLQRNPHELAARSHTCFLEQLLKRSFHRTLRDVEARTNFLIAESFKHPVQHLTLPFRKRFGLVRSLRVF